MTDEKYAFLIPTVKDFPDEPIKKQRNSKKEDPMESDDDEENS